MQKHVNHHIGNLTMRACMMSQLQQRTDMKKIKLKESSLLSIWIRNLHTVGAESLHTPVIKCK